MDRLCFKLGLSEYNFDQVLETMVPYSVEDHVTEGVNYPSLDQISYLRKQGVESSIGLHPKHASQVGSSVISKFHRLVGLSEVCDFGEVGLDHTVPYEEWAIQHDVL